MKERSRVVFFNLKGFVRDKLIIGHKSRSVGSAPKAELQMGLFLEWGHHINQSEEALSRVTPMSFGDYFNTRQYILRCISLASFAPFHAAAMLFVPQSSN